MYIITQIINLAQQLNLTSEQLLKQCNIKITIINLLDWFSRIDTRKLEIIIAKMLEILDKQLLKSEYVKERYIPKAIVSRTIIFQHGIITFKRRKYYIKPEYRTSKVKYVYLLDKKMV